MRPVEGRCLLDVVVDEPTLVEHQKAVLVIDKQKEACELNEMDSEVINISRVSTSNLINLTRTSQ